MSADCINCKIFDSDENLSFFHIFVFFPFSSCKQTSLKYFRIALEDSKQSVKDMFLYL